jgi:DNA polymerase elongation subunit (family B)
MSSYYSHVARQGNHILVREIKDGKRRKFKTEYKPTLYITTTKKSTLHAPDGTPVEPIQPGTMQECYQFLQKYKGVDNFRVYGNTGYEYAYINETYPIHIDYKLSELVVCNLDIEVESKHGFSEAKDALNEVQAITMKCSTDGVFHVFACQPFNESVYNEEHKDTVIKYHQCEDELDLFDKFLDLWETVEPDIVTGWNCLPLTSHVWAKNEIKQLSEIESNAQLFNGEVRQVFPRSKKAIWKIKLSDGRTIESSKDHIFPIRWKHPQNYSKLTGTLKDKSIGGDLTVRDICQLLKNEDVYCQVFLGTNDNKAFCHPVTKEPVSNEICHLIGCLFTDGSYDLTNKIVSFYNKQPKLFEQIHSIFQSWKNPARMTCRSGDGITEDKDNVKRTRINIHDRCPLKPLLPLIFDTVTGCKRLNVSALSILSNEQFQAFVSGLIDGDGHITIDGEVSIANVHRHNREAIQELLNWNGVVAYVYNNRVSIPHDTINSVFLDGLCLHHPIKADRLTSIIPFSRQRSSSKKLKLAFAEDLKSYWVKIDSVTPTTKYVEMQDIETSTHYFVTQGVHVHNCRLYDIPYLINRISRIMSSDDAKRLSPWNQIRESTINVYNKVEVVYDVVGLSVLDYLLIYRKNVLEPRESYRLDYIAEVELKERKLDYSEYGSLSALYENDFKKFIEYNIHDVRLVDRIDAKRKLIELQLIVAYHAHVNVVDVLSQVRTWDTLICNHLLAQGVVIPQKSEVSKTAQFTGAFVMQPVPGMYEWIVAEDVQSLYPRLMQTLNIGMETKLTYKELTPLMRKYQTYLDSHLMIADDEGKMNVNPDAIVAGMTEELWEELKIKDVAVGANGVFYRRDPKSFYSVMIEELFQNRLEYRKKLKEAKKTLAQLVAPSDSEVDGDVQMVYQTRKSELETEISIYDLKQHAMKIMLNALYGSLGNEYARWFDVKNAEAVTTTGQFIIQYIGRGLDAYLNKKLKCDPPQKFVIYSDTDSVYLALKTAVDKFCPNGTTMEKVDFVDNLCKEAIQKEINRLFRLLTERYLNGVGEYLLMNREVIGDKGIWTAKKRYLVNVRDKEGIRKDPAELKIMGVEIAKSSVPKFCRDAMKEAVTIIMEKDQQAIFKFVKDTKKKFKQQRIEDVSFPRSVNGLEKYGDPKTIYTKGTPFHTKGVLVYNSLIDKYNLDGKYSKIKDGEKIKFFYLLEPNSVNVNAMAFSTSVPTEFGMHQYIDWETQFSKSFLEPLQLILSAIGWDTQPRASLSEFFD